MRHDVVEEGLILEVNDSILVPNDAAEDAGADEDEAELPHHGEELEPVPFVVSGKNVLKVCNVIHCKFLQ